MWFGCGLVWFSGLEWVGLVDIAIDGAYVIGSFRKCGGFLGKYRKDLVLFIHFWSVDLRMLVRLGLFIAE